MKINWIVLTILNIAVVSGFVWADETSTWQTYSNDAIGYEFKYPSDTYEVSIHIPQAKGRQIFLQEKGGDDLLKQWRQVMAHMNRSVGITREEDKALQKKLYSMESTEIYVDEERPTETLEKAAEARILAGASAAGPTGMELGKITSQRAFVNPQGVNGYEIYLNQICEGDCKVASRTRGPEYAFDITPPNTSSKIYLIFMERSTPVKKDVLEKVVNTLKVGH